jgi:hypothetical protein
MTNTFIFEYEYDEKRETRTFRIHDTLWAHFQAVLVAGCKQRGVDVDFKRIDKGANDD